MKYTILLFALLPLFAGLSQISLTNVPYTQDFNSMGTSVSLPQDWRMAFNTSSPNWTTSTNTVSYIANSGTPSQSGLYNWSTTSGIDRAVGAITPWPGSSSLLAHFSNSSLSTISLISVAFDMEGYSTNNSDTKIKLLFSYDGINWTNAYSTSSPGMFNKSPYGFKFNSPITYSLSENIFLDLEPSKDLFLQFQVSFGTQAIGFDNIVITPIPEPSILMSLCIALSFFGTLLYTKKGLTRRCS